jgi:hypothetical protein
LFSEIFVLAEVVVSLWDCFKNRWGNNGVHKWIGIVYGNASARWLRRRALCDKDERLRLEAAQQLGDQAILKQMALEATSETVRAAAAALVDHQPFLAAIALSAWDIEQGLAVVARIQNELLLRRVARSARQDAIRLAAAKKADDPKMLKQIARSTADLGLRWETARHLNDPELIAEVALYKPASERLAATRREAHAALLSYLDMLARQRNVNDLLAFLWAQPHLPFKLHAFLRLPANHIHKPVLQHIARQKYRCISPEMIRRVLSKIETAGWRLMVDSKRFACVHCNGNGVLLLKTVLSAQNSYDSDTVECPDCEGSGKSDFFMVTCIGDGDRRVVFKLPPLGAIPSSLHLRMLD